MRTRPLAPAAAGILVGADPWDILMIPGRDRAYVLNHGAHVDGTAEAPWRAAFSPDPRTLYAVDGEGTRERILVVDLERGGRTASFRPRGRPGYVVPGPMGGKLYVMLCGTPEVQVYDARSLELVHRIPVGNDPAAPLLSPDGSRLYMLAD